MGVAPILGRSPSSSRSTQTASIVSTSSSHDGTFMYYQLFRCRILACCPAGRGHFFALGSSSLSSRISMLSAGNSSFLALLRFFARFSGSTDESTSARDFLESFKFPASLGCDLTGSNLRGPLLFFCKIRDELGPVSKRVSSAEGCTPMGRPLPCLCRMSQHRCRERPRHNHGRR